MIVGGTVTHPAYDQATIVGATVSHPAYDTPTIVGPTTDYEPPTVHHAAVATTVPVVTTATVPVVHTTAVPVVHTVAAPVVATHDAYYAGDYVHHRPSAYYASEVYDQ